MGSKLEEMKEITQYLKSLPDRIDKILASVPVCWCWMPLEHSTELKKICRALIFFYLAPPIMPSNVLLHLNLRCILV